MERTILHCDCNSFFASVECTLYPELKNVPMAVGGSEDARHGIILAKNEHAKKFGVKTAETIWQAKRKCPELVIVPPHHDLYEEYSKKVNAIYKEYTDLVEPFGIDESWLDVTKSHALFGDGKTIADTIRKRVKEELGINTLGDNLYRLECKCMIPVVNIVKDFLWGENTYYAEEYS